MPSDFQVAHGARCPIRCVTCSKRKGLRVEVMVAKCCRDGLQKEGSFLARGRFD